MENLNPARAELLKTFSLDTLMVRGEGCQLHDVSGKRYLDFLAQYGALPFGHNPPEIWAALTAAQTAQTPAMMQPLRSAAAERLAARLAEVTPGDLGIVTFTNSGAETVEAAIKLARVRTGRDGILSTLNSFHGKTLGALSATGKPVYQVDFAAPAPGFDYIPYGDAGALRARLANGADDIGAFIVEPVQGEGGVVCPPDGYLDEVIAICREFGVLSIFDEIQTGLGRTGALFACEACAEPPDMLLLSKALGGGLMPIGACIVRPSVWDDRFGTLHSSTFANNALACLAGCATIDRLLADDRRLLRDVAANGIYLRTRLEALQQAYPSVIRQVRGRGYMAGLEFHAFDGLGHSATMAFASLNGGATALISSYLLNVQGVLTAPLFNASHVLRLQPPLVATRAEIDIAVDALAAACDILARQDYHALVRHLVDPSRVLTAEIDPLPEPKPVRRRGTTAQNPHRFAFLIHYTEEEDVYRSDPSFRQFGEKGMSRWLDWVKRLGPGYAHRIDSVTSRTEAQADGWLMSVPMLPRDMRGKGKAQAQAMIQQAVDLAAGQGASRLGLGAFTSVVTRGGEAVTGRGVAITSGNTLTTVAAVKSIETISRRVGLDIENAHVVVIGATGAIGCLASVMLARRAGRLTLVGNADNPFAPSLLARAADDVYGGLLGVSRIPAVAPGALALRVRELRVRELARGLDPDGRTCKGLAGRMDSLFRRNDEAALIACTTDRDAALADADIVLVATSSEMTLVDPRSLRPGTLVCDIARPPNVAKTDLSDTGVLVFDGGLITPPSTVDLGPFQTLGPDLCWGCLGETMLLAVAGQDRDFSIGSRLPLADADLIATLAERHGFEPARPQWYGTDITSKDFHRFAWLTRSTALPPITTATQTGPQTALAVLGNP